MFNRLLIILNQRKANCKPICHLHNIKNQLSLVKCLSSSNEQSLLAIDEKLTNLSISAARTIEPESKVAVKGWIQRISKQKQFTFIQLNDGHSTKPLHIVVNNDSIADSQLNFGASLYCEGVVKECTARQQKTELLCDSLRVIGDCKPETYPMSYKNMTWKNIRQIPHLRSRVGKYAALMRVRSELLQNLHQLMRDNGYILTTTPIITSVDCEGAGHVFTLKSPFCTPDDSYFDTDVHLTVSGQLHLEAAAAGLSRVYTVSPAFRAENSQTNRHVSEFTMVEVEEAFTNSLDHLMDNTEFIIKSLATNIFETRADEMKKLLEDTDYKNVHQVSRMKYIRMTYDEALELVNKKQTIEPLNYGDDLGSYHEKVLLDYFDQIPVFITHYPVNLKPFYMKRDKDKALCFDLICPIGGEVCGGSLREDNYEQLEQRISQMKNPESFKWYLELREFGSVPHGGFGIGFDRFVQSITGLISLKDVITFPRWSHHCKL